MHKKNLKVYLPMKVSNEEIREKSGAKRIDLKVRIRRWKCLRHVLRMPSDNNPKISGTNMGVGRKEQKRTVKRNMEKIYK